MVIGVKAHVREYMINRNNAIPWIPVVIWMAVIFFMSKQPAAESNNFSHAFTARTMEAIDRIISIDVDTSTINDMVPHLNYWVRKSAHFIIYSILGILAAFALVKNGYKHKAFGLSFLFCVLFAASDEIHQLFVPGRGGSLGDLTLDSLGALTGILFYFFVKKSKLK